MKIYDHRKYFFITDEIFFVSLIWLFTMLIFFIINKFFIIFFFFLFWLGFKNSNLWTQSQLHPRLRSAPNILDQTRACTVAWKTHTHDRKCTHPCSSRLTTWRRPCARTRQLTWTCLHKCTRQPALRASWQRPESTVPMSHAWSWCWPIHAPHMNRMVLFYKPCMDRAADFRTPHVNRMIYFIFLFFLFFFWLSFFGFRDCSSCDLIQKKVENIKFYII